MNHMLGTGAGAAGRAWWWDVLEAAKTGAVAAATHGLPVVRVTDAVSRGPRDTMRSSTPAHGRHASGEMGSSGVGRLWHLFRRPERFSAAHVRELDALLRAACRAPAEGSGGETAATGAIVHKEEVVEAMRELAEVLVWGDQHGASFFEDFLEAQMLQTLMGFLELGDRDITVQLVQTLGILIENLSDTRFLYYLLSNNYINHLIENGLGASSATSATSPSPSNETSATSTTSNSQNDATSSAATGTKTSEENNKEEREREQQQTVSDRIRDSDLVACYVSFLKTLSLRLDARTINFFFNEQARTFPLYTEALRLFNHRDSMVRTSVRVLTLNVFRVDVPSVRAFVVHDTAPAYFRDLCSLLARQFTRFGTLARTADPTRQHALAALLAELSDNLSYMQDVFDLGITDLSALLCQHLLHAALVPVLLGALVPGAHTIPPASHIPPRAALFLLAHVYHTLRFAPLLNALTELLFYAHPTVPLPRLCPRVFGGCEGAAAALRWRVLRAAAGRDPVALGVFMLVCALVGNGCIDRRLLLECGFVSDTVERTVEHTTKLLSSLVPEEGGGSEGKSEPSKEGVTEGTGANATLSCEETQEWQKNLGPYLFNPMVPLEEQPLADKPVVNLFEGAKCDFGSSSSSPSTSPESASTSPEESAVPESLPEEQKGGETEPAASATETASAKEEEKEENGTTTTTETTTETTTLEENDEDDDNWGINIEGLESQTTDKPYLGLFVDNVMATLANGDNYRVVTVEMGVLLLEALSRFRVYEGTAAFVMDAARRRAFEAACAQSVAVVVRDLGGPLAAVFLELFEDAASMAKRPATFDALLADGRHAWPLTASPESRLRLAQRLPFGEAEATQKAVLVFLTLRRHRLALSGSPRDTLLPLRALPLPRGLAPGAAFRLARGTPGAAFRTPAVPARPQGRTLPRYFAIADGALVVLDVPAREREAAVRRHALPAEGVVEAAVPIETVDVEATRDSILATSHACRWRALMLFDSRTALLEAHHLLDAGRRRARQYKMAQIYAGLGIPDATVSLPPRPCDFPDDESVGNEDESNTRASSSSFLHRFSLRRSSHEHSRPSSSESPARHSSTLPNVK